MTFRKKKVNRGRTDDGEANPVDIHVGLRLRSRRVSLGLSQEKLAAALGVTFQQVQKYERGANRVGASRLFDLARALEVPVAYFFEGMPGKTAEASPAALMGRPVGPDDRTRRGPSGVEIQEFVRYYRRLPIDLRTSLAALVKAAAAAAAKRG